ncbi:phosphotransferase [Catellatospora vulcania]|uniref:phosphotransferase n=1 Tax=Catellatospora vulcania TaxID=1460450 RepID=UPI001E3E37EE|nr:phosphotransferase [Catellatospora vulcania]
MVHTHELTVEGTRLTKRYVSWDRDEHLREWTALQLAHRHEPGLVPQPLDADLTAKPPTVTMSVVPGEPLSGAFTPAQARALHAALAALWRVPHEELATAWPWSDDLRYARMLTDGPRPDGGLPAEAYDAAVSWWDGPDPESLRRPPTDVVLGQRDPHLGNYLWDGNRVRIVDFEDAAVSDPATELAILSEHLSLRATDTEAFCAKFDVDGSRLLAARRLWAMFWLRLLLPGGRSAHRNPPGAADTQAARLLHLLHH